MLFIPVCREWRTGIFYTECKTEVSPEGVDLIFPFYEGREGGGIRLRRRRGHAHALRMGWIKLWGIATGCALAMTAFKGRAAGDSQRPTECNDRFVWDSPDFAEGKIVPPSERGGGGEGMPSPYGGRGDVPGDCHGLCPRNDSFFSDSPRPFGAPPS